MAGHNYFILICLRSPVKRHQTSVTGHFILTAHRKLAGCLAVSSLATRTISQNVQFAVKPSMVAPGFVNVTEHVD